MPTSKPRSSALQFTVSIVVEPDAAGYYAYCPALKGLHTCGSTEREALENARDAAIAYIRSLIKHGEPIPVGVIVEEISKKARTTRKHRRHHLEQVTVSAT
ncbi:MAG: type II toxin-antitoxin system HicB family antitoxin [Candidatus Bipolaricaulota bacterium]|nr:type II toxin-antitoxin system HicB family antitoxin [Candidatus Bipolaricaulota bacterium]